MNYDDFENTLASKHVGVEHFDADGDVGMQMRVWSKLMVYFDSGFECGFGIADALDGDNVVDMDEHG